ncbi:MAG: hypothetical protein A3E26_01540 [Chlamydiae bacterium RIFCSPHIGHO2_12_FULL_49_32]|nr:MAG: hypothetical protein A3E26_01540 [Chlamydiae bacterium RIFCSPHIGHO2_12_FULL_49_32]
MRPFFYSLLFFCLPFFLFAEGLEELFSHLNLAQEIEKKSRAELPLFYNQSLIGGYFLTPSARMATEGMVALGGASIPPYNIYGGCIQLFPRFELSGNYRTFKGGIRAFLDEDSERILNAKLLLLQPGDGWEGLPFFSVGGDLVVGSKSKQGAYLAATRAFHKVPIELTVGWGIGSLKGWFGGAAWTPFEKSALPLLKNLTLLAEYDPTDYRRAFGSDHEERRVDSRWNAGLGFLGWDVLQITAMTVRGRELAASASVRYPLGTTKGFLPKEEKALPHMPSQRQPALAEEIKPMRDGLLREGIPLYSAYLFLDADHNKSLFLTVINTSYREEREVRRRLAALLAAFLPSDVAVVDVIVEADGIPVLSYRFRSLVLSRYLEGKMSEHELFLLSTQRDPCSKPSDSLLLYRRNKPLSLFTFRPRLLTYFLGDEGKFKYNLGVLAASEGNLFDLAFYRLQVSYALHSSPLSSRSSIRDLTPRSLPEVRTDSLRYHETARFSLEEAYLQRGWLLGRGWFARLSGGYFEPAYAGGNAELLYCPVSSSWAFGAEGAVVFKRRYDGAGLTHHVRKIHGRSVEEVFFLGKQAFFNLHYFYKPYKLDFLLKTGRFLAKDFGCRLEMTRTFSSGFRFSLWYTLSGVKTGQLFHDRGFAFAIPLDFFLKKSSRSYIGYAIAATLRNNGALSATGKPLYFSLNEERR